MVKLKSVILTFLELQNIIYYILDLRMFSRVLKTKVLSIF